MNKKELFNLMSNFNSNLATKERQAPLRVGVVGLGPVGTLSVKLAIRGGFEVVGYDRDSCRVNEFKFNNRTERKLLVSDNPECLADANIVLVAIRLDFDESGNIELEPLQNVARMLNALPSMQRLIVLESTAPPGVTRRFAKEWLQSARNDEFLVAHCPERLKVGDTEDDLLRVPRLVGGLCEESTQLTCQFLEHLGVRPVPVSAPEISELSKLLENVFLTVGIGLMGEVTRISHALSLNANEVAQAASSKPEGYFPFWPGAGIGGHCLPNDLRILRQIAVDTGVAAPLLDGVSNSIELMTPAVIDRLGILLEEHGLCFKNARIWIIGVGFKVGSSDLAHSPAYDLVRGLRRKSALPIYSDSNNKYFEIDDVSVERVPPETFPEGVVAAVVLAGDPSINLNVLDERIPVILDVGGAKSMPGNSSKMQVL
ncbi:hypothetical protein MNBD_GAMMA16-1936 [hydrothermal vent metagenome]|uniref:UDP-N-acetylglucosamine 6-dehydrogenase n=1 Tax=hydrothermal vent metagenome TaxID=652676 RepID=A0A3B0ZA02_9ZZZZ